MVAGSLLILDACVLIDLVTVDLGVVRVVSEHVGPVHVAENVLAEVKSLDRTSAIEAGLVVVEPSFDMLSAAAERRAGLSFQDHLCLLLAKANAWTCVSNDKRLRSTWDEGVTVLWSLELLARLVEGEAIPTEEAVDLARRMADGNPYLTAAIIERFVTRVSSSGRS